MNQSLQPTQNPQSEVRQLLETMKPELAKALPRHIGIEKFARILLTTINSNNKLQYCEKTSLLAGVMAGTQLGLELNTNRGQAYLIPYMNRKKNVYEAQFQIGYKGLIELAYRTNSYKRISAESVFEGDIFEVEFGLEPKLRHVPLGNQLQNPTHYYALYQRIDGGFDFKVWTRERVEAHKSKYCKSQGTSPWDTNFNEMAKKTVLKDLLKTASLSVEVCEVISRDNQALKIEKFDDDVLLLPANDDEFEDESIESKTIETKPIDSSSDDLKNIVDQRDGAKRTRRTKAEMEEARKQEELKKKLEEESRERSLETEKKATLKSISEENETSYNPNEQYNDMEDFFDEIEEAQEAVNVQPEPPRHCPQPTPSKQEPQPPKTYGTPINNVPAKKPEDKLPPKRSSINKEEFKTKNSYAYKQLDIFIDHPIVSGKPRAIDLLKQLKDRMFSRDEIPVLAGAMRSCAKNDFSALENLVKMCKVFPEC